MHCCKGDSACRVRVCTCLRARMCACTFLCVRACVPASVRACICTPEHVHEVYQAFWPACTHICAINRVQMCRNQRVRFYHAAHDQLYLAVISRRYNRSNTGDQGSGYNQSFYSQQLYPLSRTNGYNRFDLRLYIPACIHATAHVCMLFCLLVHLCSCVTNHPRASTC